MEPGDASIERADVLIVGAGPAGLSAALELKRLGIDNILIADREAEAGGTPRLCHHTGFGWRDLKRVLTGPAYARQYRERAARAGIAVHTSTTITEIRGDHLVSLTSPLGPGRIDPRAILLATGVRERPRAARLIPGTRPQGIFTTGSLQRFVYEHHLPIGRRALIVGAETISLSVVLTLMHAGVRVLAMLTGLPRHQLYMPYLPAKWFFVNVLARAPLLSNVKISEIFGRQRLEGVAITHLDSGKVERLECDTLVLTGDWMPENELARRAGLEINPASHGPDIDAGLRTSRPGIFAAGNLLRGVETADWAALEGRRAAHGIQAYLDTNQWRPRSVEIQTQLPLEWICPNVLTPDRPPGSFHFESGEFRQNVKVQAWQGEKLLHCQNFGQLIVNSPMNLRADWAARVDFDGQPVRIGVASV